MNEYYEFLKMKQMQKNLKRMIYDKLQPKLF